MTDFFHQIGLDTAKLRKMSPEGQLIAIANARKAFKGTDTEWVGVVGKAFGKANTDLVKFLDGLKVGGQGIAQLKKEGLESGLFLSKENIKDSKDLWGQLDEFGDRWKAVGNTVSSSVTPAFTKFFEMVNGLLREHHPAIKKLIEDTGKGLDEWVDSGKAKEAVKAFGTVVWHAAKGAEWLAKHLKDAHPAALALGIPVAIGGTAIGGGILGGVGLGIGAKLTGIGSAAAPSAGVSGASSMGLMASLARFSPYLAALFLKSDSKQPANVSVPIKIPERGTPGRISFLERQIQSQRDQITKLESTRPIPKTPAQAAFFDRSEFGKFVTKLKEQLTEREKELWKERNHVEGLFQKPQPTGNTTNHNNFNITIYGRPNQDEKSIGREVVEQLYSRLGIQEPAIAAGKLYD